MADDAPPPPLPTDLVPTETLHECLNKLLETHSWEVLTLKVVLQQLEQQLLPDHPPGTLKPFKKGIKAEVDTLMKRILNAETPQAAPPVAPPAPPPPEEQPEPEQQAPAEEEEEKAPEEAEEAPMEDDALVGDEDEEEAEGAIETEDAPPGKRRKLAEDDAEDDGAEGKAETSQEPEAMEPAEGADDDDDEDDDPDAPRVAGKPTHKLDGKTFYQRMVKGDEELRLGQDVYLENNLDVPYVARLTEIFIYSFAPTEVYFNARWYYRKGDVHEYAKMAGAKADVLYEGSVLEAEPKELFFSTHMDENHADCILRSCAVHYWQRDRKPSLSAWDVVNSSQHEYLAWRAYDNKNVHALTKLVSKKLRDACEMEGRRGPQDLEKRIVGPSGSSKKSREVDQSSPLLPDELRSIWLPRKHLEVWLDLRGFNKVATGIIVRCAQIINGSRTFYAAYVMGIKRAPRPYKVGSRITDIMFQVRTQTGNRLVDITAISNVTCTDLELSRFKVPLDPEEVRKKIRGLQQAMRDESEHFEAEDLRIRQELEERMQQKLEEEARAEMLEEEERERKERERDEVRRRAAANKQENTEAWWLSYTNKGGDDKEREIAKLRARLTRFKKIADSSTADGERENARRLADQAEGKLNSLLAAEEEEEEEEAD